MRVGVVLVMSAWMACGSTDARTETVAETETETETETDTETETETDTETETEPEPETEPETENVITLRYQLETDRFPAGDSSTNVAARMSGVIYGRNSSDQALHLEFTAFASYQLEWSVTRRDRAVFKPMFMPPPMPPPGGIPQRTVDIGPQSETIVAQLYGGISGFYEESAGPDSWGPLPAGEYEGVLRGINLGTGSLATAPFQFVVDP